MQQDLGLNRTLEALKHYFLLDQGDLLVTFLDTAEEELVKPASQVSVIRLQSLLDSGKLQPMHRRSRLHIAQRNRAEHSRASHNRQTG